jgi:cytochrome c peroxidase
MRIALAFCIAATCASAVAACSDGGAVAGPSAAKPAVVPPKTIDEQWPVSAGSGLRIDSLGPVPPLPEWQDNPASDAKRSLGLALFADARLSSSGTVTCGNCHSPVADFQSNTPLDLPSRSLPGIKPTLPRNTPSLVNIVYAKTLHWDGSESDLYESMVLPLAEANMNLTDVPRGDVWTLDVPAAKRKLYAKLTREIPGYVPLFQGAFGEDITQKTEEDVWLLAGKALATYIRVAVSRDAAFDAWNAGDSGALSDAAKRGFVLFVGEGKCVSCHSGPMFSDYDFHNLSLLVRDGAGDPIDPGRERVTKDPKDLGSFLTPSLRRVTKSSPFFHDGSQAILGRAIQRHSGAEARTDPNHDPVLDEMPELSVGQLSDLIQFLKSLAGAPIAPADLALPVSLPK